MDVDLFDLQNNNNKNECKKTFNKLIECFANIDKSSVEHSCLKEISLYVNCHKEKEKKM